MNPVNATSLYVSASRSVLQCDPRDPRALAELCKLLPFFRQSLSCLVCGNVLQDPIAPTDSSCQHYVCRGCKGQRMQLKPSCSWCKDYTRFEENRQLSLLVHCYRKLCLYISQSPLAPHIASAASDSPDLQEILNEGLILAETEQAVEGISGSPAPSHIESTSDVIHFEDAMPSTPPSPTGDTEAGEQSPANVNGLHECNGLVTTDTLQPITIETVEEDEEPEGFPEEIPVCVSVTATGEATICEISTFGDNLKHAEGPLLLSVEEVLRTLETDSEHVSTPEPNPQPEYHLPVPPSTLNGPICPSGPDSSRLTPSLPPENSPQTLQPHPEPSQQPQPEPSQQPHLESSQEAHLESSEEPHPEPPPQPALPHAPYRCHRKRSRSESDSQKLQPLPISSLLQGCTLRAISPTHQPHPGATNKNDSKYPVVPPNPHLAPVPNGGPPKVAKTVLVPNKGIKKTIEQHAPAKKPYAKSRQGAPKPRAQPRDRVPTHTHPVTHTNSSSKPMYKKPVEKKGCKCGRATQNPSVLTCRGQRCPCYSNRKACLDCICRGCQNSFMANGEKKLEAFAVPEKALEQTRLTLGINLTSIAAAALRGPAPTSPASALLNVTTTAGSPVTATFLTGAGHDARGFEESLEMRFDC